VALGLSHDPWKHLVSGARGSRASDDHLQLRHA
jgi:hypothetical protein